MTSIRTRAATRIVSALGVKRKLQELADSYSDQARFDRLVEKIRRYDRRDPPSGLVKKMDHERIDVEGHELHLFRNPSDGPGRLILYLHGGGYMFGPFAPEWKMIGSIAADTGSDLAVLLYPRTPESDVERTINVVIQAYVALLEIYHQDEVVLVGTSAGGGLAVALNAEALKRGVAAPSRVVLVSPSVDMSLREDVSDLEEGDVLLSADYVRLAGQLYGGALGAVHPWASPIYGDLRSLAPMQVFAGSREILGPSIKAFVGRVNAAGSSADIIVGEGQQHTWPTLSTPEGQQARDAIVAFIAAGET